MLDLNVDIVSSDSTSCDEMEMVMEVKKHSKGFGTQMEDSGTSNSSVVNAEEAPTPSNNNAKDEDSNSNTNSAFIFDILKKHEADGKEELGQGQFAQLLQHVLQELSEVLAEKNVVVIQNIKIINGSKLRKVIHLLNIPFVPSVLNQEMIMFFQ